MIDAGKVVELASVEQVHPAAVSGGGERNELPPLAARLSPKADGPAVLRLRFTGEDAEAPVIARLSRHHGVEASILYGQVDSIRNASFGTLVIAVPVSGEALAAVIRFLENQNVVVESLGYLAADIRAAG